MSRNKKSEVNSEFIGVVVGAAAVVIGKLLLDRRSPRARRSRTDERMVTEIKKQLVKYRKQGNLLVMQEMGHA